MAENIGDVENRIQQALAQLGVCCIVMTPSATASMSGALHPYLGKVTILVRVIENVVLNRSPSGTNKQASEVAEAVAFLLHNFQAPAIAGQPGQMENIFLDSPSITIANPGPNKSLLCYDVRLQTQAGLDDPNQIIIPMPDGSLNLGPPATTGAPYFLYNYYTDVAGAVYRLMPSGWIQAIPATCVSAFPSPGPNNIIPTNYLVTVLNSGWAEFYWNGTAWTPVINNALHGNGSPLGVVVANPGAIYVDVAGSAIWAKMSGTDATGWQEFVQL